MVLYAICALSKGWSRSSAGRAIANTWPLPQAAVDVTRRRDERRPVIQAIRRMLMALLLTIALFGANKGQGGFPR